MEDSPRVDDDEDGDGSAWEDETPEALTGSSSRGSTSNPAGILDAGTRKAAESLAATVATAASTLVDARMGAGTGAFLMGEDEAAAIAAPASRIMARHAPLPGGGQATDVADGIELIVAVVGYVMAGLARRAHAFTGRHLGTPNDRPDEQDTADEPIPPAPMPAWPGPAPAPMVGTGA